MTDTKVWASEKCDEVIAFYQLRCKNPSFSHGGVNENNKE